MLYYCEFIFINIRNKIFLHINHSFLYLLSSPHNHINTLTIQYTFFSQVKVRPLLGVFSVCHILWDRA